MAAPLPGTNRRDFPGFVDMEMVTRERDEVHVEGDDEVESESGVVDTNAIVSGGEDG